MTSFSFLDNMGTNTIAAAFAALCAEFATLPVCVVKTNYQNGNTGSIRTTALEIYKRSGLRSFYTASFPALFSQMISTTTKYTFYEFLNENTSNPKVVNGWLSGVTSSLITHPVDIFKIHYQMNTPVLPILKQTGPSLFYRGYSKTLTKVSVSSCLFFPVYDYFKQTTNNNLLLSGVLSGFISTTVMHPIDYMKTRQIYGLKFSLSDAYKGISLSYLRIIPHFSLQMILIEFFKRKITNE